MSVFLSVENINLTYQTPEGETQAVKDVSFTVREGEFISIVGPSGCGKSSLLSCIAGVTLPTKGRIMLEGRRINGISNDAGYMLQSDNLMPWRNIYKNAVLGLEIQKKLTDENISYVRELLKKYGLWEFRNSYPASLSGGMRQRVALIRTLAVRPRLLLLDEAFSALDYQTRVNVGRDVYNILRSEKQTMIMVTHDIPEAVSMSDRVIVLSQRPAVIAKTVEIPFGAQRDTVAVRNTQQYRDCYDIVWKEMSM
ncbi:MAG: ABC transporter ATP-binding protein [Oscillospiraceae bacterium]|nr:ABC transporter ATP-binding protein [Oscillospiraceae bacterium]